MRSRILTLINTIVFSVFFQACPSTEAPERDPINYHRLIFRNQTDKEITITTNISFPYEDGVFHFSNNGLSEDFGPFEERLIMDGEYTITPFEEVMETIIYNKNTESKELRCTIYSFDKNHEWESLEYSSSNRDEPGNFFNPSAWELSSFQRVVCPNFFRDEYTWVYSFYGVENR